MRGNVFSDAERRLIEMRVVNYPAADCRANSAVLRVGGGPPGPAGGAPVPVESRSGQPGNAAASFAHVQGGQEILESPYLIWFCRSSRCECNAFTVRMRVQPLVSAAKRAEEVHIQVEFLRFGAVGRDTPDFVIKGGAVSE